MADHREPGQDDLACKELVDGLTEYFDEELSEERRSRVERHFQGCEPCRVALDQFQTVIRLAGRLTADDVARIDALTRDRLMAVLRAARRR